MEIFTLDLNFQDVPGAIAAYLIPHPQGAMLIETGPGSTIGPLEKALALHGYLPHQITDALVTHIHLDHAGAAGWLAGHGAKIHVHHFGLPHLLNPERLLHSAGRIYGDQMGPLWGGMLPVPADHLNPLRDGDLLRIGGLDIRVIETPGHATHHMAFVIGDTCFAGDIGGVRLAGPPYIMLPMPPPEFHLEQWRASLAKLRGRTFRQIAPTHFGLYTDAALHLDLLEQTLADVEAWILQVMPASPPLEELQVLLPAWFQQRAREHGLTGTDSAAHELANPAWMSAAGIDRYWRKSRVPNEVR